MVRPRKRTKSERELFAKWNKRLSDEGLGVMGDANHWTFPGVTAKGVGFTSLTAQDADGNAFDATELFEADNERDFGGPVGVADTPTAVLFRRFAQVANDLPPNYPGRRLLLAFAETGYLEPAARRFGMGGPSGQRRREKILKTFCARFGFDFDAFGEAVNPDAPDPDVCHDCPPKFFTNKKGRRERMWHSKHADAHQLPKTAIKRLKVTRKIPLPK